MTYFTMKNLSLITLFLLSFTFAKAQETYSDEELTTYATVMVWAEAEKGRMSDIYNNWINNDEKVGAKLFLDIKNAKGDSLKIQELDVTEEQLAASNSILAKYDSMTSSFKEVYVGKIKGDIGAGLYNKLKKSLKSDAEVKAKYDAIYEELESSVSSTEGDTE